MDWTALGKKVADFAPVLGSALGPGGTTVGALIASAFGTENTPGAISAAISSDPEAALKLKQIELDHEVELKQIALEGLKAELLDKQNARLANGQSNVPERLSYMLTALIVVLVTLLFWVEIPVGSREVLFMLLGVVVKEWGGSMQYWNGTTRSSADKTRMLLK